MAHIADVEQRHHGGTDGVCSRYAIGARPIVIIETRCDF